MTEQRRPDRPRSRPAGGARPGGPQGRPASGGYAGGQGGHHGAGHGGGRFGPETIWLFGIHAVRDALLNPKRDRRRLVLTQNAAVRLGEDAIAAGGLTPEIHDPRRFDVPIDPQSVHQGAALEVAALDWGTLADICLPAGDTPAGRQVVILLDRVTDPHNVGAVLRSAEVFGALAVVAPARHSAPETGALAKTASGALERQPYLRVKNLGTAMEELRDMGYIILGLDGEGEATLAEALAGIKGGATRPVALALGAEGPGLREKTREMCDALVRIPSSTSFASLNVSNAAAVALYAAKQG
jgi:23S rRNA (guanosine2251-2'-O)-methyltransferase